MHELTSEVNSSEVHGKVMAMLGIRTAVADPCMFGLAVCDEGGPGFVNGSVRTITNARRVGVRLQNKCGSMHRHAQVKADNTIEKRERTGSWVHQVAQAMEEKLKEDQQELETREQKRKVEYAKRIRRIVHENDKNKGLSHVQNEMGRLARREEVEYIRRHKMYTRISRETCLRETGKAPIKTGWAETDKGQPGNPNVRARWVAKEYKTHARK